MQIKIKTILNEINNQNLCLSRGKDYFYFTYSNIDEISLRLIQSMPTGYRI